MQCSTSTCGSMLVYVVCWSPLLLLHMCWLNEVYKTQEGSNMHASLPTCQLSPHNNSTRRPQACISNTITGQIPHVIALMVSSKLVIPSFPHGQTPCWPVEEHSCLLHRCRHRSRTTCLTIPYLALLFLHPWPAASCTPSPPRRPAWQQQRRFAGR